MPSVEIALVEDIPVGGIFTVKVAGVRPGDVVPGTGTVTVDEFVQQVEFSLDFTNQLVHIKNLSPASWLVGATLVLSWEGELLEGRVGVLEANLGVTDESNAIPGQIGEYLNVHNIVGVVPPVNIPKQVCLLSLPPGCWEVWGACDFTIVSAGDTAAPLAAPVAPNQLASSISLHPDGLPTQDDLIVGTGVMNLIYSPLAAGQRQVLITGQCRSNSINPITLYLVGAVGSANANVKGYMSARRVR